MSLTLLSTLFSSNLVTGPLQVAGGLDSTQGLKSEGQEDWQDPGVS